MNAASFTPVLAADGVAEGESVAVEVAGRSVLVCRSEGVLYAIENSCSHAFSPLECGRIRDGWIACPAHGARFDLASGEALKLPASEPIATFPIRTVGGMIEIAV